MHSVWPPQDTLAVPLPAGSAATHGFCPTAFYSIIASGELLKHSDRELQEQSQRTEKGSRTFLAQNSDCQSALQRITQE